MRKKAGFFFMLLLLHITGYGQLRHLTVSDGLPTGEVQQLIELPNGQILADCEGVYCLTDGKGFEILNCDWNQSNVLPHFVESCAHLWQGDSLLWLRSFHRIFLFDARKRMFLGNLETKMKRKQVQAFIGGGNGSPDMTAKLWGIVDSLKLSHICRTAITDRQGGLWIGTRNSGIYYLPPERSRARLLTGNHPLINQSRSTKDFKGQEWHCTANSLICLSDGKKTEYSSKNVEGFPPDVPYNFIVPLLDGQRYLLCVSTSTLGYFQPDLKVFTQLNDRHPQIQQYRFIAGACITDEKCAAVYTQNGMFLLDTTTDSIRPFPPSTYIERYSGKYNCVMKSPDGRMWIGTQNGLFRIDGRFGVHRVEGMSNNCIRSLVCDAHGNVWAGTSCGISRITPTVMNLGEEDGVPPAMMMDRSAILTPDGHLVFCIDGTHAVCLDPDSIIGNESSPEIVLTGVWINGEKRLGLPQPHPLSLPCDSNSITCRFSALNYASPSHIQYRYRLLPIEEEWNTSSGGSGSQMTIHNALSPGQYQLELQAGSSTGLWSPVLRQDIIIRPPFWLTWWAKSLYTVFAVTLLVVFISIFLKKKKVRMERENEERVNQLFEIRENARRQFAKSLNIDAKAIAKDSKEEELVNILMKHISQNLDNSDYTVDQLASDTAMSRASLYKKMHQMLGITPSDFIRSVRLKEAAKLLLETTEPINQIAGVVGFQTPRNFSLCFKQMFGVTPKEYRLGNSPKTNKC